MCPQARQRTRSLSATPKPAVVGASPGSPASPATRRCSPRSSPPQAAHSAAGAGSAPEPLRSATSRDRGGEGEVREADLVSVVVPMYNEEATARELYRSVCDALAGIPFELVAADDGSTDATPRILAELAGEDERVKVVT